MADIAINDMERLTKYGFGYLTGLAILFLFSLLLSAALGMHLNKARN